MSTMKAVVMTGIGPAKEVLKYQDFERPMRTAGEVLVKVDCAAINPIDFKTRSVSQCYSILPVMMRRGIQANGI